jgi:hypothetical protein
MRVHLSAASLPIKAEVIAAGVDRLSTRRAVESSVLFRGLRESLPHLFSPDPEEAE